MSTITTADVRAYIAKRHDAAAANATINRELAALKRMFALALQASKLLYRPHIPMLRENNVRTGFSSGGISKRSESTCRRHCGPS